MLCSLVAANEKIYSSPGKQHLERHNDLVSKTFDINGIDNSSFSSPSASASPFVTPTKSIEKNGIKFPTEEFVINIPRSAVKLPLDSEKNHSAAEFSAIPINPENILQELIHSKLLLASVATELQEEKHLVNVLSKVNQRYAEKVAHLATSLMTHLSLFSWQS